MSNVVSWSEFYILRRCPGLPSVSELKLAYEKLVASYGSDVVSQQIEKLVEAMSDPSLSRKWILFFSDSHPISYIAKLEGVSPSSVKRSLAKAMKELTDQVAKEETDEETNQPMSHAFA